MQYRKQLCFYNNFRPGKPSLKRTNVDQLLNKIVYYVSNFLNVTYYLHAPMSSKVGTDQGYHVKHRTLSAEQTKKRIYSYSISNFFQILGLLLALCTVCGVGSFIWESLRGKVSSAHFNYMKPKILSKFRRFMLKCLR